MLWNLKLDGVPIGAHRNPAKLSFFRNFKLLHRIGEGRFGAYLGDSDSI